MLWTLFVILLVVWFVAMVTSYTMGGLIHLLLLLAAITLIVQVVKDRRSAA